MERGRVVGWISRRGPPPGSGSGRYCRPPATCSPVIMCSGAKRHVQGRLPRISQTSISGTWAWHENRNCCGFTKMIVQAKNILLFGCYHP